MKRSLPFVLILGLLVGCTQSASGLQIAGSTSVQPVAEVLAEAYHRRGGGRIRVQGGGSTAGVQAVLSGVAEIGAVSRALTPQETRLGLQPHRIAWDVLAVVVHPANPITDLTSGQLSWIFSGAASDWDAVGGRPGPIRLVSREAGSGSREAFRTRVGRISPTALVQGSSGAIRLVVMGDRHAIGYVNLGTARMSGLKPLRIDGLSPEAVRYPLRRPLSFVTAGRPVGEAAAFLRFAVSPEGQRLIQAEGLVPAHEESGKP